jgi:hypothetical protein
MKTKKPYKKLVKLIHCAFNPYSVSIGDFVLKLAYSFNPIDKPRIEVFENTELAQSQSWDIYGALDPYILLEHTFEKEGDSVLLPSVASEARLAITWIGFEKELYPYAKGSAEVFEYTFEICMPPVV